MTRILVPILLGAAIACVLFLLVGEEDASHGAPPGIESNGHGPRGDVARSVAERRVPPFVEEGGHDVIGGERAPAATPSTVAGRVLDEADRPLRGARVVVAPAPASPERGGGLGARLAVGASSVDGAFELEVPPSRPLQLSASLPGHASTSLLVPAARRNVVLRLLRAVRLRVVVEDEGGAAVEGATVDVWSAGVRHTLPTDEQGGARFDAVAPGPARVRARSPERGEDERPGLLVGPEGDTEVLLRLRAATILIGDVRAAGTERPIPGAHVSLVPRWDAEVVTDAEGRFGPLPAGVQGATVVLHVRASGYASALVPLTLGTPEASPRVDVLLETSPPWSGLVVDGERRAVVGARVGWRLASCPEAVLPTTTTSASGAFSLPPPPAVPPGHAVHLAVEAAEGSLLLRVVRVASPPSSLEIVLGAQANVAGRVLTAEGTAAREATVRLRPDPASRASLLPAGPFVAVTNAQGRWNLPAVPPGRYAIDAHCGGLRGMDVSLLDVEADRTNDGGTVTLHAGRTLTGTVVSERGAPIGGALVGVKDRQGVDQGAAVRTDAGGAFSLPHAPAEACVLWAYRPGVRPARRDVGADEGSGLRITLLEGAALEGTVSWNETPYPEAFTVVVRAVGGQVETPRRFSFRAPRGRFVIEDLEAGEVMVTVEATRGLSGAVPAPLDLVRGSTASVRIELRAPAE